MSEPRNSPDPAPATSAAAKPGRHLRRARFAVAAYFFLAGMVLATWASRIPAVKQQTGLDEGGLSIALLGLAVGALAAMQVAGRLADRFGSVATLLPAALLAVATLVGPGHAYSLPMLFATLFALGAGHGLVDVPMNVEAARVERHYGRPIMASFHAAFSVGMFVGAGVGALAAATGVGAAATFWAVALVLLVPAVAVRRMLLPREDPGPAAAAEAPAAADTSGTPRASGARPPRIRAKTVLFGVLAFACFLGEGAATDWTTVYLHDELATSGALAAVGFAVFSATMAAGRMVGDRLTARFGPVAIVRAGGLLAACGLGASLLVPSPAVAITGFGLLGAGLSCIVPQIFTATVNDDPLRAGRNLGFVAGLGYLGMLSGPVVIGAIAHALTLTIALAVPAVLALGIAAGAAAIRPSRPVGGAADHGDNENISRTGV
ncbi:fucose permease [Murinocardiopsis flavida]|uniref:Fucose permease n=1 Tax=Murinocardiopsis flavida TaxID=645275 RepID=A0A2P8DLN3_9ACTN|nr:MFS transporter [Murinocardiopsis flavida]PSK98124.1 fucose permease [Murinocardiopsis flavida]